MNKQDRTKLEKAIQLLSAAKDLITEVEETEQEKFDNLSEVLQATERGQRLKENAIELNGLQYSIDESIDSLNDIIEQR